MNKLTNSFIFPEPLSNYEKEGLSGTHNTQSIGKTGDLTGQSAQLSISADYTAHNDQV